ncbi:hypothetical protein LCGC14_0551940 [marine sediment metagenome]|uniref:Uncharacterized protein n=1 Tax=marine sediment metagenome TaxID=412755 RepID=A0A0F9S884_9ZZZZ
MKVILKRTFFTPKGRFRASLTKKGPPVEIPDEYREILPSDAKIVDDDYVAPKVEEGPQTLSEAARSAGLDVDRVSAEDAARVFAKAEENELEDKAKKFQDDLAAEKAAGKPKK